MTESLGVNQNWRHELNICEVILDRERERLEAHRRIVQIYERMVRMDLERINSVKARICQLESHGNDRKSI